VKAASGLCICIAIAACAHAFRAPENGGPGWIEARSAHFVLQTDAGAEQATAKLVELERLRAAMTLLWNAPGGEHPPIDIFLPRNADERKEFTPNPVRARIGSFGELVLIASAQDDLYREPRIKRAMAGTLNDLWLLERVPWLATGLEHYLSGVRVDGADVVLGEPSLIALKRLRDHGGPQPISWVVDETRPWASPSVGTSWLLVHYLMDVRRTELIDLLRRLGRGEPEKDALAGTVGRLGDVDDDLQAYWKAGQLGTMRVALPPVDERVVVRPLPAAELHAWRADLLPNYAESRDERDEARRQDPREPRALVGIKDRADGIAVARAATLAHPDDWRAWYLLWFYASGLEIDDSDDFYLRKAAPRGGEADAAAARAAASSRNEPLPHLVLADLALLQRDAATGLHEAEIVIRNSPRRPL